MEDIFKVVTHQPMDAPPEQQAILVEAAVDGMAEQEQREPMPQ